MKQQTLIASIAESLHTDEISRCVYNGSCCAAEWKERYEMCDEFQRRVRRMAAFIYNAMQDEMYKSKAHIEGLVQVVEVETYYYGKVLVERKVLTDTFNDMIRAQIDPRKKKK